MSTVRVGRVSKHRRRYQMKTRSELRMMVIMQDRNSEDVPKEFLETGRTGRRNAMPDILHPQGAEVTTSNLPGRLQQLVMTDLENPQPGTSKTDLDVKKVDEPPMKKDSCS